MVTTLTVIDGKLLVVTEDFGRECLAIWRVVVKSTWEWRGSHSNSNRSVRPRLENARTV